jgi:four helix bundle protein
VRKAKKTVAEDEGPYTVKLASRIARPHENLQCWKEAVELVTKIYRETQAFPAREQYGLTAQLRRAAVSVPSNIAEGVARHGNAERKQVFFVARGSLSELETQVIISVNLGFLSKIVADGILVCSGRIGAMLNGLIRR